MMVVGFYTRGTSYEKEAELLAASLDKVGMEYEIRGVRDRGDWYANTAFKAQFLRGERQALEGPILYLDVDAFVHENCTRYFEQLGRKRIDFGAHWFTGPAGGYDRSKVRPEGWWMLSGTLFLGDTPGCRKLLDTWVGLNTYLKRKGIVEGGGQKQLWYLTTCMKELAIERLPGRYAYVFDKAWCYPPGESRVIEHLIASRENRGKSSGRVNIPRQNRIAELHRKVGWEPEKLEEDEQEERTGIRHAAR